MAGDRGGVGVGVAGGDDDRVGVGVGLAAAGGVGGCGPGGRSALLAGYFHGSVADTDAMVTPVLAHRDGRLAEALPGVLIGVPGTQVSVLPGPRSHAQAGSLAELWPALLVELQALRETGQDVIVDVGRLGMVGSPRSLIAAADLVLLLVRSDLPALAAARQRATDWAQLAADGTGPGRPGSCCRARPAVLGPRGRPGAAAAGAGHRHLGSRLRGRAQPRRPANVS